MPKLQELIYHNIVKNVLELKEAPEGRNWQIACALLKFVLNCINRTDWINELDAIKYLLSDFRRIMKKYGELKRCQHGRPEEDFSELLCSAPLFGLRNGVANPVPLSQWIDTLGSHQLLQPWRFIGQVLDEVDWLEQNNFNLKTHDKEGFFEQNVFAFFDIGGCVEFRVNAYFISDRSDCLNVNTGITVLSACMIVCCAVVAPYFETEYVIDCLDSILKEGEHPNTSIYRAEEFATATLKAGGPNFIMGEPDTALLECFTEIRTKYGMDVGLILRNLKSLVIDLGNHAERVLHEAELQKQEGREEYTNAVKMGQTTEKVYVAVQKAKRSAAEKAVAQVDMDMVMLRKSLAEEAIAKMYQVAVYQSQPVQPQKYEKMTLQQATDSR